MNCAASFRTVISWVASPAVTSRAEIVARLFDEIGGLHELQPVARIDVAEERDHPGLGIDVGDRADEQIVATSMPKE